MDFLVKAPSDANPYQSVTNFPQFILQLILTSPAPAININDESDFNKWIDRILDCLSKGDDWQKRIQGLINIQAIAWGNLSDLNTSFHQLRKLQDHIGSQLTDLRSSVSKEACKTVAILSYRLKTNIFPLVEFWWQKLLRLVALKIQVMAEAADNCIKVIILSCPDIRLLTLLCEMSKSKTSTLRRLCVEYISLAFATWNSIDLFERCFSGIKSVLKICLNDADQNTRKSSRVLFRLFSEVKEFGKRITLLQEELDTSTIKSLATIDEESASELSLLLHIMGNKASVQQSQNNEFMSADLEPLIRSQTKKINLPTKVSTVSVDNNFLSQTTLASKVPLSTSNKALSSGSRRMSIHSGSFESPPKDGLVSVDSNNTDIPRLSFNSITQKKALTSGKENIQLHSNETSALLNGPKRMIQKVAFENSSTQSAAATSDQQPLSKPHQIAASSVFKISSFLPNFLRLVTDLQWSNRTKAFESLSLVFSTNVLHPDIPTLIESTLPHIIDGMSDNHQKVVVEALKSVKAILTYTEILCVKIDEIMLCLFQRLLDTRPMVRDMVNQILTDIRGLYRADDLLVALVQRAHEIPDRAKTALLQFMGSIVPSAIEFFKSQSNIQLIVLKLSSMLCSEQHKPTQAMASAGKRLLALVFNQDSNMVCKQILTLPFSQQTIIKQLLTSNVPDIDQRLVNAVKAPSSSRSKKNDTHNKRVEEFNELVLNTCLHDRTPMSAKNANTTSISPIVLGKIMHKVDSETVDWIIKRLLSEVAIENLEDILHEVKKLLRKESDSFWSSCDCKMISALLQRLSYMKSFDETTINQFKSVAQIIVLFIRSRSSALSCNDCLLFCTKALELIESICGQKELLLSLSEVVNASLGSFPVDGIKHLLSHFSTKGCGDDAILTVIQAITFVLPKVDGANLIDSNAIGDICNLIIPHLESKRAEIRQSVILLIAELYIYARDSIFPYVESLNQVHRKLVLIYVEKRKINDKVKY